MMAMPYRIGMTIALRCSVTPRVLRPAIALFPMDETWTGIKESSNG
jgi:hypothetical protein